jgi:hypothetical protein
MYSVKQNAPTNKRYDGKKGMEVNNIPSEWLNIQRNNGRKHFSEMLHRIFEEGK